MRQQEQVPQDPNHENVIDISSDEENNVPDFDSEDEEDLDGEGSRFFQPSADVEAFNAKRAYSMLPVARSCSRRAVTQLQPVPSAKAPSRSTGQANSFHSRRGGRSARGGAWGGKRKGSGSGFKSKGKPYAAKKKAPTASTGAASHKRAPGQMKFEGGGGGFGMMPT